MYYTLIAGLLMPTPELDILHESIRNLYYHVPMWFGMTLLLLASFIYSLRYLSTKNIKYDFIAEATAVLAVVYGIAGIITGSVWARVTWGAWWNNDPKQMAAAIGLLMYFAYFVLRNSLTDIDKRARISAVANVLFFAIFIPAIYIVPRLTSSLHPGSGGNPGFNAYDLDSRMRMIFYPAVIGWTLLGFWMVEIYYKTQYTYYQIKLSLS
jgi:heme exporter protein C